MEPRLPQDKQPKVIDIYAAQKIIADISTGLYRSPAAALKELVSNAYDADADSVIIDTDVPHFRTLTVRDDGTGINIQQFLEVMTHIGGSRKRINSDTTEKGRKVIGRIGIGLLAVAQLGFRFFVSSSRRGEPYRFIAEVDLEPFHKDDAALMSMGRIKENTDEVHLGAVRYVDDIYESSEAHYTVITIPDAKKGLVTEITGAVREAVGAEEKLSAKSMLVESFNQVIEIARSSKRVDMDLDAYYYMLWELAQLCPIDYSEHGPFDTRDRSIEGSNGFTLPPKTNFHVVVDGLELRRPQHFPSKRALTYSSPDPKIYPLDYQKEIAGRLLQFSGYIYTQQPRVEPEELNGVHIRIRNVGIGKYDRTWLGYPFDEGIKFGQITGEIFVEHGLEPALNIDRDSFRETDVHFQALRAFLWDKLRKDVFPDFKLRQKTYSKQEREKQQAVQEKKLAEKVALLPAPILSEQKDLSAVDIPILSSWIGVREGVLRLTPGEWESLCSATGLKSQDAQNRFLRVLRVLLSTELLVGLTDEEARPLLEALAIAVQ